MRTSVYVDGFNLYYLALKGTPYKWLDLHAAVSMLLQPRHWITRIKYYSAPVTGRRDPRQPIRQQTYWRALEASTPVLKLYKGTFLTHKVTLPLASPTSSQRAATVLRTEEKGSDVNLAVHLVNDAWLDSYDCAVVISNDSDLAEALRVVRLHHPGKVIGLVFPRFRGHPSRELVRHATFVKHLGRLVLKNCQLPRRIPGTSLRRPEDW